MKEIPWSSASITKSHFVKHQDSLTKDKVLADRIAIIKGMKAIITLKRSCL